MLAIASSKARLASSMALSCLLRISQQNTLMLRCSPNRMGLVDARLLRARLSASSQLPRAVSIPGLLSPNSHRQRLQSPFIFRQNTLASIDLTFGSRCSSTSLRIRRQQPLSYSSIISLYRLMQGSRYLSVGLLSSRASSPDSTLSSALLLPTRLLQPAEQRLRYAEVSYPSHLQTWSAQSIISSYLQVCCASRHSSTSSSLFNFLYINRMITRFLGRHRSTAVRVRYAPSPTGKIHLGGLRTALYNKLFAQQCGGSYVLRIEDTDRKRLVPGSVEDIQHVLKWAGLEPDQGPINPSAPYGPYVQSERVAIYRRYLQELKKLGLAYPCFCTSERLDGLNSQQKKAKQHMKYDGRCRLISKQQAEEQLASGRPYTYRFLNDTVALSFRDTTYGCVSFQEEHFDDFILIKSDGWPTYHFANVVDDIEMKISHVIRGQEWLTSTPKHLLLYSAFRHLPPEFVHLPLILSPSGGKLSKRDSSTAVQWYIDQGYEPEAVVNAVALLGWTPQKEGLLSWERLTQQFNLSEIHKAPATLNPRKLDWLNKMFIKEKYKATGSDDKKRIEGLRGRLGLPVNVLSDQQVYLLGEIALERVTRIPEIMTSFSYVLQKPNFLSEGSQKDFQKVFGQTFQPTIASGNPQLPASAQKVRANAEILKHATTLLEALEDFSEQAVRQFLQSSSLQEFPQEDVYHLLRYCLTGRSSGPGVDKLICLLGKSQTLSRLKHCF